MPMGEDKHGRFGDLAATLFHELAGNARKRHCPLAFGKPASRVEAFRPDGAMVPGQGTVFLGIRLPTTADKAAGKRPCAVVAGPMAEKRKMALAGRGFPFILTNSYARGI